MFVKKPVPFFHAVGLTIKIFKDIVQREGVVSIDPEGQAGGIYKRASRKLADREVGTSEALLAIAGL